MKTLCSIIFLLSCFCGFSMEKDFNLRDYTFPVPEKFVHFADLAEADGRRSVSEYFRAYGISIPPGGKISLDRTQEIFRVKLPKEEALKMLQVLNYCVVHTSARFFRGAVDSPNQENDETDAKAQFVIPANLTDHAGISIHFEKRTDVKVTCVIVNNTEQPTWFEGSCVDSPSSCIQELVNGRWVDYPILLEDGLGLRTPKLLPKRACRFEVDMRKTSNPIRIGIALLDDVSIQKLENRIWTKTIPVTPKK